jgi:hypothetical protein
LHEEGVEREREDENAAKGPEEQAKVKQLVGFFGFVLARRVVSSTAHVHSVEACHVIEVALHFVDAEQLLLLHPD